MGICICLCCNKNKTNCLENTLIVFNTINFIFYILLFIIVNWKIFETHKGALIGINIITFIFLLFNLLTLVLVKIFVELETIYTTKRTLCYVFAYISMFMTIINFFFSVLSHSLGSSDIHKCQINLECIVLTKDKVMLHLCCSLNYVFCLIGSFMWYNLMKRIKYCVREKMIEDTGLINYGVLGAYLGRNNHKNKGKSTGKLYGNETIYIKNNNTNSTRNMSNLNSFVGTNRKSNNFNVISEQPEEESNNSNQEEEKEVKIQGPKELSDDEI